MKITFLGAAHTVTGSCFLIETKRSKVMVDCGMFQGPKYIRERNYKPFLFNPETIDFVLLTHAHIDHSGMLPKLIKHGYRGKILATKATVDLCEVMLPDSGYIQENEVEKINRKNLRVGNPLLVPIYTEDDAIESLKRFQRVNYQERIKLTPEIEVRYNDAGHILGSAILELWVNEAGEKTKLVFSGDLGNKEKPFLFDPTVIDEADYVVMESTYGKRSHEDRQNTVEILHDIAWETHKKGGNLIIPAFAVERTQDLLYEINLLVREGRFPPMDIYIDSPMAIAATEVFKLHEAYFDDATREIIRRGENPLNMPSLKYSKTMEDSIALNNIKKGAVIISASGMCDAGRIKHHLRHNLWRPEATILFVGYQAPGTKGAKLLEGVDFLRIYGEEIKVRADIRKIDGYSAHADQEGLLDWVAGFSKKPKKIFLVHGELEAAEALGQLIEEKYAIKIEIPKWQDEYDITVAAAYTKEQVSDAQRAVSEKLQRIIDRSKGEKELTSIMHQLNDLEVLLEKLEKADEKEIGQ
ncbi:MAG: MBL fold metallo-hydrolase [Peptococcaceae bacterium]|nr:MBL fold metallo-hydrolase [Peptococcaceae bacterium]